MSMYSWYSLFISEVLLSEPFELEAFVNGFPEFVAFLNENAIIFVTNIKFSFKFIA
jgi:hypothetical protein